MSKRRTKNYKGAGIFHLCCTIVIIALLAVVSVLGIGGKKIGSVEDIHLGLDLAGGVSITYETVKEDPTNEEMEDTVYKLQKRVENYSTEAQVYQEGNNRINVDIPGVSDANEILEGIGKAGAIQFITEDNEIVIDGSDIEDAEAVAGKNSLGTVEYYVSLDLNEAGSEKFATATGNNIGRKISIYYDGEEISSPTVEEKITGGKASISQSTFQQAKDLAMTIRIGALPLELKELRSSIVGAQLGSDAIQTSLVAGAIGFILVLLFMIFFYRISGVASSLALAIYVGFMLVILSVTNITLTLPGIAGIILSIGMAVDANVIIFTRIKEEIATGKTVRSSIKIGFDKALSAIIDGNVTTLIAAAVLYFKGSGTVKGFAQTLALGIVLSMITALFVTRIILNAFYNLGIDNEKFYGIQKERKVYDFVQHSKTFFGISGALILVCIGGLIVNKNQLGTILNYGLEFSGGSSVQVTFPEDENVTTQDLETFFSEKTGSVAEPTKIEGENAFVIKTRELSTTEIGDISEALINDYNVDSKLIEVSSISGTVSSEMKQDAIIAVIIASICMLIYIWIRFKDITFGTSAVLALVHDVLVVLMVYAVGRISVGNTFIACMLTIVGYSINATIVIFDRVRENLKGMTKKDTVKDAVNKSITQTISRSINTSVTTFIMVFALFILGVDSVKEFAGPLMAGIICGAYSSVCIAGTMWYMFKNKIGKVQ